jgi:succinyl-diaminopimelate desuccinylase
MAEAGAREAALLLAAVEARAGELYDLLAELVRAPSTNPPGDTRAAAAVASTYLASGGLDARQLGAAPERPSVIATLDGAAPRLLFLSHLDTVPLGSPDAWQVAPFGAEVRDGRLYGRGAADAKASAAAMLLALRVLATATPQCGVALALVADEETGGAGVRYLLEQGLLAADAVVVGETTANEVAIAEKGAVWLKLHTWGRTAHASVPQAGINAAQRLVRWLDRLERYLAPRLAERRHPLVPPPSLTLTLLAGGVAPNVVPDHCEAVLDRRTLPGETLEAVRAELLGEAAALEQDDPAWRATVEVLVWAEPFETPAEAGVVQAALAARRRLGLAAAPVGYLQASDGRFFGARGVPTIILGPGRAEDTHVPDESVALEQVLEAAKLYVLLAHELAARSAPEAAR